MANRLLKRTNSDNPDFRNLIIELDKDLWSRYADKQATYDQYNKIDFINTVIVAYMNHLPVGCGCFKKYDDASVEIKRMFVATDHRGLGIASAILNELETWAKKLNYSHTVLETGNKQFEAIRLYQKTGYQIIKNYGPYADISDSICMRKEL